MLQLGGEVELFWNIITRGPERWGWSIRLNNARLIARPWRVGSCKDYFSQDAASIFFGVPDVPWIVLVHFYESGHWAFFSGDIWRIPHHNIINKRGKQDKLLSDPVIQWDRFTYWKSFSLNNIKIWKERLPCVYCVVFSNKKSSQLKGDSRR